MNPNPKTPPRFLDGERAILGGLLIDQDALSRVVGTITAEDFAAESNRVIFAAVCDLFERNQPVDWVTLTALLAERGKLEAVGGQSYLIELADATPSAANIQHYAAVVRDKALLRRLIGAGTEIVTAAYSEPEDVQGCLDDAERLILQLGEDQARGSFSSAKELMKSGLATVEMLYERHEYLTGIASGFKELDSLTAGFQASDLIIIAGRPSMGKTSLALNIGEYAAAEAHIPTAIFSLEMSEDQIALRLLCSRARVNLKNLRSGFIAPKDWSSIVLAAGIISDAPIYVDDSPAITPLEIRTRCRRLKREANIGLVIIDYLQLMRGIRGDNREQEISEISRSLKALAKELNVPVIALSQLNRKVEERGDKRPMLSDLRESGAIEQDADVIIFIYRDEVYNKSLDNPKRGVAEIIVGKQRNGPVGTVEVAFRQDWSTFLPLSRREDE